MKFYVEEIILLLPNENEKYVYNKILKYILDNNTDLMKNKLVEILCSNINMFIIKNVIDKYLIYLNMCCTNLLNRPYLMCTKEVRFTNILDKKVCKINQNDLNKIEWNLNNGNIIYDEIIMVNTYDTFWNWGYSCDNKTKKLYKSIGFVICKANNGKYNIFPSSDDGICRYNTKEWKFVTSLKKKYVSV